MPEHEDALPADTAREWWRRLESGAVTLQRCARCRHEQFPPGGVCRACGALPGSDGPQLAPLSGAGRLVSWTTLHRSADPAPLPVPYTLGFAQFAEDVHVLGVLDGPPEKDLQVVATSAVFDGRLLLRLRPHDGSEVPS